MVYNGKSSENPMKMDDTPMLGNLHMNPQSCQHPLAGSEPIPAASLSLEPHCYHRRDCEVPLVVASCGSRCAQVAPDRD